MRRKIASLTLVLVTSIYGASCADGSGTAMTDQEMFATYYLLQNLEKKSIYGTWTEIAADESTITHTVDPDIWKQVGTNLNSTTKMADYSRDSQIAYVKYTENTPATFSRRRLHFTNENLVYYCEETSGHTTLKAAKEAEAGESFVNEDTANCNSATWPKLKRESL